MKADDLFFVIPAIVVLGHLDACTPDPVAPPPYDAAVVSVGSAHCRDGLTCPAHTECGDNIHCPKGKCCEVLGPGNDAGIASGTRRVVGEPK